MIERGVRHQVGVDSAGGRFYGYCQAVHACGWTGPWRRWRWRAAADARRHATNPGPL